MDLCFDSVGLRFGKRQVLRDVSFRVCGGEVIGFVGPNGAGKTSIARLAAGFTLATSGNASVAGMPPRAYRQRMGIGYAPEELPRVEASRVRALLALRGDAASTADGFGAEVIRLLQLEQLLDTPITRLSKGQWRTVLLAYAIMPRPSLLILDEPDSGLDPGALERLATVVRVARRPDSVTLVLSHQLFELERVCDRVLFVRNGSIAAEETGRDGPFLRNRYREIFA